MNPFTELIDDAGLLAPGAGGEAVATRHRELRAGPDADAIATLLIQDRQLAATDRLLADATETVPVTVINTGGAGGLTALAGRSAQRLAVVAVDTTLRDPGDLVGNAARVCAAARELDPDIAVHVEIPYGSGWQAAVEEVEAQGLYGLIRMTTGSAQLVDQLSGFVEADLSFAVDQLAHPQLPGLLLALDALIDDADTTAAAAVLDSADQQAQIDAIGSWDDLRWTRVRRRLRRVRCNDPAALTELLHRWS
ncbi:MAG TPA: hypothetical protein VIP98_02435 [Microlunatus sp.]